MAGYMVLDHSTVVRIHPSQPRKKRGKTSLFSNCSCLISEPKIFEEMLRLPRPSLARATRELPKISIFQFGILHYRIYHWSINYVKL